MASRGQRGARWCAQERGQFLEKKLPTLSEEEQTSIMETVNVMSDLQSVRLDCGSILRANLNGGRNLRIEL